MERTEGQTDGQTAVSLNALIPWRRGRKNGHDKWFREHPCRLYDLGFSARTCRRCLARRMALSYTQIARYILQALLGDDIVMAVIKAPRMTLSICHVSLYAQCNELCHISTCHTKGLFTAHELNWNVLQQGDPVTRHVHWSHASASWFGWKLGRFVLSPIMRCEHCSGNACDVLRIRVHFSSCAVNKL